MKCKQCTVLIKFFLYFLSLSHTYTHNFKIIDKKHKHIHFPLPPTHQQQPQQHSANPTTRSSSSTSALKKTHLIFEFNFWNCIFQNERSQETFHPFFFQCICTCCCRRLQTFSFVIAAAAAAAAAAAGSPFSHPIHCLICLDGLHPSLYFFILFNQCMGGCEHGLVYGYIFKTIGKWQQHIYAFITNTSTRKIISKHGWNIIQTYIYFLVLPPVSNPSPVLWTVWNREVQFGWDLISSNFNRGTVHNNNAHIIFRITHFFFQLRRRRLPLPIWLRTRRRRRRPRRRRPRPITDLLLFAIELEIFRLLLRFENGVFMRLRRTPADGDWKPILAGNVVIPGENPTTPAIIFFLGR